MQKYKLGSFVPLLLRALLLAGPGVCGWKEPSDNRAILINCSWQHQNYRHAANVIALQSGLLKNGYSPQNISIFMKQDPLDDRRNTFPAIHLGDFVTLHPQKDYDDSRRRCSSFYDALNMLSGEDPVLLGAGRNTNLLVYITGHGGNGFIKYCNRKYYYTEDLTRALVALQRARKLKHVLVVVDTCQADSLLDTSRLPDNVTVLSTSLVGESSYSADFEPNINLFPVDLFARSMYSLLSTGRAFAYTSLHALAAQELSKETLLSTITIRGSDVNPRHFFAFGSGGTRSISLKDMLL